MEGLSIAASVTALVHLTQLTLKLAKNKGLGPSQFDGIELESLSRTLYAFNGMLQNLELSFQNEEDEIRLLTLNHLTEPLDRCREALNLLSDRLKNATCMGKYIVGERFDGKLRKALSVIEDAWKLVEVALLSDQQ